MAYKQYSIHKKGEKIMENINEAAVEEVMNNDVVKEAVVEAAKEGFDWMKGTVTGLVIFGAASLGVVVYKGGKFVYKKFIKPRFNKATDDSDPVLEEETDETEGDVIDLTEEKSKKD